MRVYGQLVSELRREVETAMIEDDPVSHQLELLVNLLGCVWDRLDVLEAKLDNLGF